MNWKIREGFRNASWWKRGQDMLRLLRNWRNVSIDDCQQISQRLTFSVNLKHQKLLANETLLKEKITHLEADLMHEIKTGEQLKQSAKYCKQEEEVFQTHLARFEVESNQVM